MVTVLSPPYCCTSFNARAMISMDKKCKNAYLIEARHFKHDKCSLYVTGFGKTRHLRTKMIM